MHGRVASFETIVSIVACTEAMFRLMEQTMKISGGLGAVDKALDVLLLLGRRGVMTGTEISKTLRCSKSTTSRILSALEQRALVRRDNATRRISLGYGVVELASTVLQRSPVSPHCQSVLEDISAATAETAAIHVVHGSSRICVFQAVSGDELKYVPGIGSTVPLYAGAASKVLVAFMSAAQRARILAQCSFDPFTESTRTRAALAQDVDAVRRVGYAVSFGERVGGSVSVSVPILDGTGGCVASLSVFGPRFRIPDGKIAEFVGVLQAASRRISEEGRLVNYGGQK